MEELNIKQLETLANNDDADAQFELGHRYYVGNKDVEVDYKKSVEHFLKAASQQHKRAQLALGIMHRDGTEVEQSNSKMIEYYTKSAMQGYADAQFNLGCCYEHGEGVDVDYKEAARLYNLAATQGYVKAMNSLAGLYYDGLGVDKDVKKAYSLYKDASALGHETARLNLSRLFEFNPEFSQLSFESSQGSQDPLHLSQLAQMYFDGIGLEKNRPKGVELALQALSKYDTINEIPFDICDRLGQILCLSNSVEDKRKGVALLERLLSEEGKIFLASIHQPSVVRELLNTTKIIITATKEKILGSSENIFDNYLEDGMMLLDTWINGYEEENSFMRRLIETDEKPYEFDAFISHAHEDKETFVDELARMLSRHGLKIWYDTTALEFGGKSLREQIDEGIKRSATGIIVLSKSFIKKGWPKAELDAIFNPGVSHNKPFFPIWHGMTFDEVYVFSPMLAAKMALDTDKRAMDSIVWEISTAIKKHTKGF